MKVEGIIGGLDKAAASAAEQEARGYDGVWTAETSHDPFLPLLLAAQATERVDLATGITVAFARNPMTLAQTAWDLQAASRGRLVLGLGSQVKAHITKRFSMPWSRPAARMREFILAMRAIWDCWSERTELDFRGEFYTHTLMTPFFDPGPIGHPHPRVFLAGVGERMTEVAGEVADGFICHAFSTERYIREVTIPALERGRAKAGKTMEGFELYGPMFLVTGRDDREVEAAAAGTRQQVAFYGSTPAYRGVLDLHGWGDLQGELNLLSKQGRWEEMGKLIDDDMLHAFAVVAGIDEIGAATARRWSGTLHRIGFYAPYRLGAEAMDSIIADLKSA